MQTCGDDDLTLNQTFMQNENFLHLGVTFFPKLIETSERPVYHIVSRYCAKPLTRKIFVSVNDAYFNYALFCKIWY